MRALDAESTDRMVAEIEAAKADGDTLGGVVEVLVYGLPPGLGSFVHADRKLDARLAGSLMSIQAIKGVEVGDGFLTARRRGSRRARRDRSDRRWPGRQGCPGASNRAGGIEGGMTNGEVLRVRAAMKPISTVPRALATVDVSTGERAQAIHQRSDVCAVPAAGVVAEAMVALVVADAVSEKFGGDSVAETRRNVASYLDAIAPPDRPRRSPPRTTTQAAGRLGGTVTTASGRREASAPRPPNWARPGPADRGAGRTAGRGQDVGRPVRSPG